MLSANGRYAGKWPAVGIAITARAAGMTAACGGGVRMYSEKIRSPASGREEGQQYFCEKGRSGRTLGVKERCHSTFVNSAHDLVQYQPYRPYGRWDKTMAEFQELRKMSFSSMR